MGFMVETNDLTRTFKGQKAVDRVSLHVPEGSVYGLLGPNGAGKSTLFKLLSGLAFPTAGEVRLFDAHGQAALERQRARIGSMIEQPGFYPSLSVEKNLECCRIQKGVPGADKVGALLETVELEHARKRRAKDLSMGMKQRLGLAMALMGEPEVLVLDEPTSGLDPSGIVEMRDLLQRLNRERGVTVVLSSHHLAELEQVATEYAFLRRGRLMEQVSAEVLRARCADCIDIAVSDPARYVVLLEQELHHARYQVLPDGAVRVLDPQLDIEAYSGLASAHGLGIVKLERRRMSLEQYYFDLKEKGAA